MDYSFAQYLLAKQSVDDRALNQNVINCLKSNFPDGKLRIIEVGAGIGTMLKRLLNWGLVYRAEYYMIDEMTENIDFAYKWIPGWAQDLGLGSEVSPDGQLRIYDDLHDVIVHLINSDVSDYIRKNTQQADLLIAHAFLDLLPMPDTLMGLFNLLKPDGFAWLTINFDGVTILEPVINEALDEKILGLYHQTMDTRLTGGDSQSGRHLFSHIKTCGAQVMAAGASDWLVFAENGKYPFDEKYFLNFIMNFFYESLTDHPDLDPEVFSKWLSERRAQINEGKLVFIAHQIDFLAKLKA